MPVGTTRAAQTANTRFWHTAHNPHALRVGKSSPASLLRWVQLSDGRPSRLMTLVCAMPGLTSISLALSAFAGVLAVVTYATYAWQIHASTSTPNPATWLIWLVVGVLNTATYATILQARRHEAIIAAAVTVCVAIIFTYSLVCGKFSPVSRLDTYCAAAGGFALLFWAITGRTRAAHFLIQLIYLISYIPTVAGMRRGSVRESAPAWILATLAYTVATFSVIVDFNGDWLTLLYPLITGVFANAAIAHLAIKGDRSRRALSRTNTVFNSHIDRVG